MRKINHPPVQILDIDDDPDDDKVSARVYVKHYHDGAWACYDPQDETVEVVSLREDDEYVDDVLPLMLSHEFLHHLLHVKVNGSAYKDLDNIDSKGELCQ